MFSPNHSVFIRHTREHRITESTCSRCSLTVATSKHKAELNEAEQLHVCDPWLVEQWNQMFAYDPVVKTAGHSGVMPAPAPLMSVGALI